MRIVRMKRKVPLDAVFVYLAVLCLSSYALLEHASITIPLFSMVKIPLLVTAGACLLTQIRIIFNHILRKKYFYVFLSVCLLCLLLAWTMLVERNTHIGSSPVRATVRLIAYILELYFLAIVMAETGRVHGMLRFLFWYLLLIVAINDLLLFTRIVTFRNGKFEGFLVGTKFSVVYLHLDLFTLWVVNSKQRRRIFQFSFGKIAVATALVAAMSIRVDCMTGILGAAMLVLLFMLIDSPHRRKLMRFTSPVMLFLFLEASVLFVFLVESILSIPAVEYLIETVLNRDLSLTGRTNIYLKFVDRLSGYWLTGYGFGNGNAAAVSIFGYENVQNALLQWVLQVGLITTSAFVFVLLHLFSYLSRGQNSNMQKALPFVVLIYVYVILGTIETTFNMAFILWFVLIYMLANERCENVEQVPDLRSA